MKNINILKKAFIVLLGIGVLSCADPDLAPIVTFDDAGKGAYPRLTDEVGEQNIDFFDINGSQYEYSVEFIDENKGANVAAYSLDLEYVDVNGVDSKEVLNWKSIDAGSFTSSEEGYKAVANMVMSASEMVSAVGLSNADISQADVFKVNGKLVMKSGAEHTGTTSSSTVTGAAFRGHFDMSFPVVCPSDLAGTHTISTIPWCGGATQTGESVWVSEANGVYSIEGDWYDFRAYWGCYTNPPTSPGGNLRINDLCNSLSWSGASRWGEVYTFNSVSVSGADLVLDWENDYGEAGITTVTREGGANWPPLVDGD